MMAACVEKRWTLDQLFFEPAANHFSIHTNSRNGQEKAR
jgi:hypothetical protein